MRERSYVQSELVLQSGLEHRRFFVVENFLLVEFGHHYRCNQLPERLSSKWPVMYGTLNSADSLTLHADTTHGTANTCYVWSGTLNSADSLTLHADTTHGTANQKFSKLVGVIHVQYTQQEWFLKLNASKCMVMSFGRNVEKSYTYNILENSQIKPLARTDQIKDLGILLDERLTFSDHINDKINKAFSMPQDWTVYTELSR